MTLAQIGGVIRYEALMQFRRRTLILIVGLFVGGMILLGSGMTRALTMQSGTLVDIEIEGDQYSVIYETPEGERQIYTTVLPPDSGTPRWLADADVPLVVNTFEFLITFMPGMILLVVAIPPLITEVIPLDTRFKMNEMIWTKPLSKTAYLIGKVLSVWLGFAVLLTLAAVILTIYGTTQYGRIDISVIARFWLIGILPLTSFVSGYAVLLGGLTRSRRVALFIGLAAIGLSLWALITSTVFFGVTTFMIVMPGGVVYDSYEANVIGMFNDMITSHLPLIGMLIGIGVFMWAYTRVRNA